MKLKNKSSALPDGCKALDNVSAARSLRDDLWMWGHDSGVYDGPGGEFNIPSSPAIGMVEGIEFMGIPNLCVIRNVVGDEDYSAQFREVERLAWSLAMGSNRSYQALKSYVFGLRDIMPNLVGYYLDDFFRFDDVPGFDKSSEVAPAPASLSLDELKRLHYETVAYERRLDLSLVLYTHLLCPAIKPYMQYTDKVALWIWNGCDIGRIEEMYEKYRGLVLDKPTLFGVYMWDFGGRQELSPKLMARQLDFVHSLYVRNEIEGIIFHCTPLCNKNLAAVDYAAKWIAKHGETSRSVVE